MLKYVLSIAALLVSAQSFASGKLIAQPKYDLALEKVQPAFGLSIYEKLGKSPFHINSWTGYGEAEHEFVPEAKYVVAKNVLELPLFNWGVVVGAGYGVDYIIDQDLWHHSLLGKVAVKLW